MANATIYGTCFDNEGAVTPRYLFYAEVRPGDHNVDENYTSVTVALKVCRNPDHAYADSAYNLNNVTTVILSIDGSEVFHTTTSDIDTRNGKIWTFTTQTAKVYHETDGKKSLAISASFSGVAGVSSLKKGVLSGVVELDTIPRASEITSAGAVALGNKCSIKWTPASKNFRYVLEFSLGDWCYTTGVIHPNQTSVYTYSGYSIPLAVAEQITDAPSADMKVTLYTYSDTAGKTQVGDASSKTFAVTVPSNSATQPAVTMTLSPVSSLPETFAGLYIQGKTKVRAEFSATGKYGAEIAAYSMKVEGTAYGPDDDCTSDYLSQSGGVTIDGSAKDTRGIAGNTQKTVTVIGYSNPRILAASGESDVVAARCDADGNITDSGTCLKIKAKRSYSPVESGGVQKNFCKIQYRYAVNGGNYSAWTTILEADDLSSDEVITGALLVGTLSVEATYLVQIQAVDDVGEYTRTTITVPTERVYCHRDGARRSFTFGGYVEEDNTFAISEDITFKTKGPIDAQGGGNIDILVLGTKLTATADVPITLNDYKIPGNYYSPNGENSQYIADSPYIAGGFGMKVRQIQTADHIRQELFYGRTTWIRDCDGDEWSEWLYYQTTETARADYVVEIGTNSGWTYKKWNSGTYEMFGTFTVTPTEASLNASLYRTNDIIVDLPFPISSAYVSGTAEGHCWITGGSVSGDSAITVRIISDGEFNTTEAIEVRLTVVGTYA